MRARTLLVFADADSIRPEHEPMLPEIVGR
jgi:hypothetical protein